MMAKPKTSLQPRSDHEVTKVNQDASQKETVYRVTMSQTENA